MAKKDYSNWTKEELIKELEKFKKQKKYGIVWEDKPEQVALMCKEKLPVLTEVKDKEIETDENKPTNILIEGDNYHALSVLNYTHKGKIDVIYIDPPYNTGNEGFMYNDKIVDKEDAYRHSKWLSFMEKRLRLARNLLSDKGVIFISIDDNEVAQLKLLCDEIFGEENFVATLVWEKVRIRKNSALYFTSNHDFILCIAKKKKKNEKDNGWERQLVKRELDDNYKNPDNDPNGPWIATAITANHPYSANYTIKKPNGIILHKPKNAYWRYSYETLQKFIKEERIIWGKGNSYPKVKRYLKDVKQGLVPKSILDFFEFGGNPDGANELKDIFGGDKVFENPKPTKLIKKLIEIATSKNKAIILDFFAGSGTTGHAVLELNKEDGGNRKFILCTNNENNICTDVCYPRIEKVIKGYKNLKGEKVEGLGGNLKYFKTDFVDAKPTDKNKKKLVDESTEMLCLKEDCFDFVLEGHNFKIFKNNEDRYLGIIYDDDGIEPFKEEAKKLKKKFVVYVFSLDDSAREEEFEDLENVELKPIPAVILNVYKRIFRGI
ncbi:MAG: site-specific DNA-methyltransferase [Candidatus Pacearchaeota archaeon]